MLPLNKESSLLPKKKANQIQFKQLFFVLPGLVLHIYSGGWVKAFACRQMTEQPHVFELYQIIHSKKKKNTAVTL